MLNEEVVKKPRPCFVDVHENKWYPQVTTPVLIEGTIKCDIQLGALMPEDGNITVPVGSLIRLFWFACKHQAKMYGIKNESDFFEHIVTPDKIMEAIQVLVEAVMESMPAISANTEAAKTESPLDRG